MSRARWRRRWVGPVAVGATVLVLCASGVAKADDESDARQQAQRIAAQIEQLQPKVDQALADYDLALSSVAQGISLKVAAQREYAALRASATQAKIQQTADADALYKSGGSVTFYGAFLQSGDVTDLRRVPLLTGVVARDAADVATANRLAAIAKTEVDDAETQLGTQISNETAVSGRLATLQGLLAQQQQLLDQASAKAKQLAALREAAQRLAAAQAAAARANAAAAVEAVPAPIPPTFDALYHAAAKTCPGLSWTVLAAIGQVETRHGQGAMVSSVGALGPMQFMPATFATYGVDGDGDGRIDIMSPADSIFSAARYLCANGAGQGGQSLENALWHYNHADWYVQLVLSLAAKLG